MQLREIIQRLRNAKSAHLGWVNRAHSLIEGNPVDQEKIPVLPTDCIFGKWYYGEGRPLGKLESYRAIEQPHNELHEIYADIFSLLFEQSKGSFISRMLGLQKRKQAQCLSDARARFQELQKMSNVIVNKLGQLERDLRELGEEELNTLFR